MRLRKTGRWPDFPWTARCVSGRFRNAGDPWTPGIADVLGWKLGLVRARAPRPVPTNFAAAVVAPDLALIHRRESEPTAATWIGHATFLVQAGGLNVLTDPMFSEYCSPWPIPRLRRAAPPGLALGELPRIDLVLLSHAHYDHLDRASLRRLGPEIPIACPLGMGPLLRGWGFRNAVELGWGETGELGSARLCCLPGQHGAARGLLDRDATLWCGWMLEVGGRRIYFAGDTGYAPYFPELFARFAPVDLALLPIGAYAPRWFMRPLHMSPAEAVQAHRDLGSRVSIAMHWGTFRLSDEALAAPALELRVAMTRASMGASELRISGIGETISLP